MPTVYLSLGSNLGDRLANLEGACRALPPKVQVDACSSVYETPPWGFLDQPSFLNQVLQATTSLAPSKLLSYLKSIEANLGRQQTFRFGPRLIDIDILFYDDLILETPTLTIPHPRLRGRAFIWVPLVELVPELLHPQLGKTARELLEETDTAGIIKYAENP